MRQIVLANLDKRRPAVVMTRAWMDGVMNRVTLAPITTTIKGLSTEVLLGVDNGLDQECVASMDNIVTIPAQDVVRTVGRVLAHQELELAKAVVAAYDLRLTAVP